MNIEEAREYCLSIKGATESTPFDDTTLVYKIMNKMFALLPIRKHADNESFFILLKCDSERAVDLREQYMGITPGFHLHKKYWNTVFLDQDVPTELIKILIHHSIDEVIAKLSKKEQEEYFSMQGYSNEQVTNHK